MCGLVGAVGDIYAKEKDALRNLMILDVIRGRDSTGLAIVDRHNKEKVSIHKQLGDPFRLFEDKQVFFEDNTVREIGINIAIAHNRWATIGEKIKDNAHPFKHGSITGAHNGTLDMGCMYRLDDWKDFDVDSECMFYNIDKNGLGETVKRLTGAWALTYYNSKNRSMNFLTNGKRPLHYACSKDNKTLFWASEPWMLTIALGKAKIEMTETEEFEPFKHYFIDVSKGDVAKSELLYEESDNYKGFQQPVTTYYNQGGHGHGNVFQGNGSITKDREDRDIKRMESLLGKEIEFYVMGEGKDNNQVPFLEASPCSVGDFYEIRIYAGGHRNYDNWRNHNGTLTGKCKRVINRWDGKLCRNEIYMLMDMRTIAITPETPPVNQVKALMEEMQKRPDKQPLETVVDADDVYGFGIMQAQVGSSPWNKDGRFHGFRGVELNYQEFCEATKDGCCWCTVDAENRFKPEDLIFIGPKQFICPECEKAGEWRTYSANFTS